MIKIICCLSLSWTTENKDVSSANNLHLLLISSDKSLIYIKNNKRLKMDPYGTPVWISAQEKHWPFKTTLCFLSLRKSCKTLIISPHIPFWRSLKISTSCYTLSKTLAISRNISRTSSTISKVLKISWLMESSWLMQESPDLNPDWFGESRLFLEKKSNMVP